MAAPKPANEAARLASLYSYNILDSEIEKQFDDLAYLASYICGTPISLISILDEDRQWFKSSVGLNASETSREVSFCAHAILMPELLIVPDALEDRRFANNPLVQSDPKIRFYAGAPFYAADGHALGTLCVIDQVPKELSTEQKTALERLALQVSAQLELRQNLKSLKDALHTIKLLSGILPICSVCKKIRDENNNWEEIEVYVRDHSEANFTHGLCATCTEDMFPAAGQLAGSD